MTVFLRALYGPFGPFVEPGCIDWHFFGIREDDTTGRWAVRFAVKERTWKLVNFPMTGWATGVEVVHPDAFVPDRPMLHGPTYLDILKPRFGKGGVALATRLAIKAAR
jgi:hypothetical protein